MLAAVKKHVILLLLLQVTFSSARQVRILVRGGVPATIFLFPIFTSYLILERLPPSRELGDDCTEGLPLGQVGICTLVDRCPFWRQALEAVRPPTSSTIQKIQRATCGYQGTKPFVCCPDAVNGPDTNPDRVFPTPTGPRPTGPRPTPSPITPVPRPVTTTTRAPEMPSGGGSFDNGTPTGDFSDHPNRRLLPTQCGSALSEDILTGPIDNATLGRFPFAARLSFFVGRMNQNLCAGALISARYIVTAARCVSRLPSSLRLASVRLGEFSTQSDPDCEGSRCAPPAQDFTVEEMIVHPQYTTGPIGNDIALIRLSPTPQLSDFVWPVCLPFDSPDPQPGLQGVMVGWNRTEFQSGQGSVVQQMSGAILLPSTNCSLTNPADVLCVSAAATTVGACAVDSGGPLVSPGPQGTPRLTGVASSNLRLCARSTTPARFTSVRAHLRWILDSIRV